MALVTEREGEKERDIIYIIYILWGQVRKVGGKSMKLYERGKTKCVIRI